MMNYSNLILPTAEITRDRVDTISDGKSQNKIFFLLEIKLYRIFLKNKVGVM